MINELFDNLELSKELNRVSFRTVQKSFIVLRGFGASQVQLTDIDQLFEFNRTEINENKCDIKSVVLNTFEKLRTGNNYYVMYEDYVLAGEALSTLLELNGYTTYIVNNNLFNEFYPLAYGFDKEAIKKLIDNYKNTQLTEIFDDYITVDDDIMISYQTLKGINENSIIQLFDFGNSSSVPTKQVDKSFDAVSLGSTSITYTLGLIEILKHGKDETIIKEEKNPFEPIHDNLIKILSFLGYSIFKAQIILDSKDQQSYPEYETILKRRNKSYSFRSIDFYSDPGYSLNTVSISQGEIIDSIIKNSLEANNDDPSYNDIFVTAPTGSGKSVLFQIPAIYLAEKYNLFTIVISPLIGLMNDQTENIKSLTNKAATIHSEYTPEEKEKIKERIRNNEISILYVSPETLLSNNPITTLIGETRKIGLLVVDEAHIVSTWGKSFRPDYWFLGDYIAKMRNKDGMKFPIATFSATVTYGGDDDMHGDIIDSLHMKTGKYEYIAPMRRDDISFDIRVLEKENDYQKEKDDTAKASLVSLLQQGKKTIAYFPFTRTVNDFARDLIRENVSRYYGGLSSIEKNKSAEDFKSGKSKLMLATKAFGMGIDIDDIEVVYHYAPTGNLSDYVQEIGRAARRDDIQGTAITDFYKDNDYKYINQLYGMSSIKNYQIIETLRKIAKIYNDKQKRNFTVSPDDFAYIFGSVRPEDVDVSFKTTLLMIQKDFERQSLIFKPIVFKPRALFTKAYVMVKYENKDAFLKNRYSRYFRLFATGDELATKFIENRKWFSRSQTDNKIKEETSEIHVSIKYQGDIYTVNLKEMWEENFDRISFNQFKYQFYSGTLDGFSIGKELLPEYILNVRSKIGNFASMITEYKKIMEEMDRIFVANNLNNKQFTAEELAYLIEKSDVINLDHYEAIVAATTFMLVINNSKSSKQLASPYVFKFNSATNKYAISSLNSLRSIIKYLIKTAESQYRQTYLADTRTFLVGNKNNDANKDVRSLVAQLFETFNLASYDVLSGERPEYFIRVNSITKIEQIINDSSYESEMVRLVRQRHEDAKKRMTTFFTVLKSDKERWDYIEKYFAGIQEEFDDDSYDLLES